MGGWTADLLASHAVQRDWGPQRLEAHSPADVGLGPGRGGRGSSSLSAGGSTQETSWSRGLHLSLGGGEGLDGWSWGVQAQDAAGWSWLQAEPALGGRG